MRLHRLEVEGFGPFRARQTVDFDAFADDGIFLIAGRTGAGKSSILDAVCFGLYGGVPRYDGGEKRLRSDHCEPDDLSEVVVEFSTPAGRFRVTRSPEYLRPAKRGGGLTKQAAAVSLEEWTEDGWIGRAARAVDVAHELDEILQLSREQFLQVILLAQNRFSEFLLAGSRDRQALLRRLFGTERFEDVQARFDERKRTAEQELGTRLAGVNARLDEAERLVSEAGLGGDESRDRDAVRDGGTAQDGGLLRDGEALRGGGAAGTGRGAAGGTRSAAERLDALGTALARADYRAERRASERADAEARSTAADAALATVREEKRDQTERDRARLALAQLDAEEPEIAQARVELANARAAEVLRPTIVAATRAQAALAQARGDEEQAEAGWRRRGIDVADLEDWIAARVRETGGWERAAVLEQQAPARTAERQAAERAVTEAEARAEAGATERDGLPAQIAAITEEGEAARRLAARIPDLRAALDAADRRLEAAREVERLEAECAAADAVLTAATTTHAEAQTRLARLRQRRMDGMAGELAATLVDGEACAVCGSREHPAPAVHTDPVSADDIAEAEAERDAAARAEQEASAACTELQLARAAVTAQADGRDTAGAEVERAAAESEHAQAVAAREHVARLDALRAELAERADRLEVERAEDAAALAAAREQLALVVQRHQDAEAAIAEARGEFDTVAERVEDLSARVADARRLAEASSERTRRERAAAEAAAEREAALTASPFADAETAERALRSASAQEELEARISRHAVQREKERAVLWDLELRTLPEEPIDVEPFERASAEARAAWSLAMDEATRAAGDAARLAGLHESAAAEHARTAEDAEAFAVLQNLADTIAGRGANTRKMTLETFVLAAELEEIVEAANRRLHDMSEGRYRLQHSDALAARGAASGLGIVVADAFTGQTRPPQSLSGGETFLTSLALALGLAEVVTARAGGIRLDTLFIDEGFGSLDGDTLDVAMRTLDELRQGGRTVGVISHVEAMQEQIPAQLTVRALPNGPSVIETR
ncbi:SMC family ATPase [Microbacterium sp. p3-SID336]|uniref:AAA family ATPase n=1 Tax=Microbacterium sp. p3-SID336 TaxID=2916212 RepID=UPI0021A39B4B|nr:SMC family ATPase [Microbacterium sp. p3-SID336]MCT1476610.1 SMC family ATPase [Microbacterium sp. p3-SID336]